MRSGRYGKYGEIKRKNRLKASQEAKRQVERGSCRFKKGSGSRVQKFEHDKFFSDKKTKQRKENKNKEWGTKIQLREVLQ